MEIQKKIKDWIKKELKMEEIILMHPKDLQNGDFSFFAGDKAEEIGKPLSYHKIPEIEKVKWVGGFINFYLSKEFFTDSVNEINKEGPKFAKATSGKGKILIDHTAPNPFKEFHIGHLMNNAIGESITRILEVSGAKTIPVSYHGDMGLHVAKTIWGKIQKPELDWSGAYVYGGINYENHKEEIKEINKKIYEKSDPKINKLYEEGKKFSLNSFEKIYEQLGSKFDFHFYESEAGQVGKKIVEKNMSPEESANVDDGVKKIFEKSNGAVIFRGENFKPKTHTRVFVNTDGIPTYEAKEIGLAKLKKEKYIYDKSITITANEQDSFFDVVEVAIGEVFPELKGKLLHLSHGMLRLPGGKMSSRTGEVIMAESLINQIKMKVEEKLKDRELSPEEKKQISEIVAIGAIKYSILKQAIGGDIIFDFDKSISFEGDSGPYLQYTAVRANSVLEKSKFQNPNFKTIFKFLNSKTKRPEDFEITELERYIYRFPEVVKRAGEEYAPHYIVTYLTELAGAFNSFYGKERIVNEKDLSSPYKIALTRATHNILKFGLNLLAIKVPDKM
ncbi:MAG: arginine--tRNA ligase [Candidatus Zambryskibacteria bacterium]|nr:arginine--tRNA ligase [Candidatus Zambryskibacteria bacterium]